MSDIHFELQKDYFKVNVFRNAYLYLQKYTQLKDSIFGIEKNESIQELNTKYETEKSAAKKLLK